MAILVALVTIAVAVVLSFAVPPLLGLFNEAEVASTGVPASVQAGIGSFREILGVIVVVVFVALFTVSFQLTRNR